MELQQRRKEVLDGECAQKETATPAVFASQQQLSGNQSNLLVGLKGTYAPDTKKFHFVSIFETESHDKLMTALMDPKNPPRDYKKLTHGTFEILRGPLTR